MTIAPHAVVVGDDRAVQMRLCAVLAAQIDVRTTTATSLRTLDAESVEGDLLVAHCGSIEADDAAAFARLRHARPTMRFVAVCASADARSIRRALDGAVDGVVLIDQLEVALAPTVAAVLAGQAVIPRNVCRLLQMPALSFREKQVLSLVVSGCTNSEIGRRLYLAESTVKSHLSSAFSKLGVNSRSEAAALILDPQGTIGAGITEMAVAPDASRTIAAT